MFGDDSGDFECPVITITPIEYLEHNEVMIMKLVKKIKLDETSFHHLNEIFKNIYLHHQEWYWQVCPKRELKR